MRRKFGIVWKYFIAYSATATVVIFVLALLISGTIQNRYKKLVEDNLKNYAFFAIEAFRGAFDEDLEDTDKIAKKLGKQTGARITVIAPDGTVIGDSEKDPAKMENHFQRPEIKRAISGEIGTSTRYSTTLKEGMSYVAVPVVEDGMVKGVVRVSLTLQAINLLVGELTKKIAIFSIVIWVVALILTFLFSSIFSSSVKRLVTMTKKISSGNFTVRSYVKSRDELGTLSAALNEMSQKLKSLFEQLQTRHDELNAIIDSMSEGVLVLDRTLHVKLANGSFKEMFAIEEDITGRSYIETVRRVALKETVDELLEAGQVKGKRMEFGEKIFSLNGIAFREGGGEEGLVLVFHDVTSDVQIEKIKADFVANASHELRTPLVSIRGYLETLEDEEPETQKRFIKVIHRNVERMSNLISDLLLLSRLESNGPPRILGNVAELAKSSGSIEQVDLFDIAEDVVKLIERPAKKKGIELEVELEQETSIAGDAFLLEQMLLNLLDNAVKYTECGKVSLQAKTVDEGVTIQISDTGTGIPSEHLPRIFERFYRVDKARSRELGGTGLGLSIVKHIVQLHGGEISVKSQSGVGTTFTVHFPAGIKGAGEKVGK